MMPQKSIYCRNALLVSQEKISLVVLRHYALIISIVITDMLNTENLGMHQL